jgi:hypothetical protein
MGVLLDKLDSLLDSLCDIVRLIHLLDSQLIFNILHALTLNLSKLKLDWWRHLLHHVVKRLLHAHELVTTHHTWWEVLGLGVLVALSNSVSCKHHLHVDVWIHVHSLTWESHLTRHHHASWEVANVTHVHVTHWIGSHAIWLRHVHFVWTATAISSSILVLSEFSLSMCI